MHRSKGAVPKATRVLRGGAFNNNRNNVRCSYRNRNDPNNRNNNIGFRVSLSTFFNAYGNALRVCLQCRVEKWRELFPAAPLSISGRAYMVEASASWF